MQNCRLAVAVLRGQSCGHRVRVALYNTSKSINIVKVMRKEEDETQRQRRKGGEA